MSESKPTQLNRLQRWMMEIVAHPGGVEEAASTQRAQELLPPGAGRLDDVVAPSKEMTSEDRIRIYANMYVWRQVDVLAEDFPQVRHLLGSELFHSTAIDYLVAHPSQHYSLSMLAQEFPEFVLNEAVEVQHREFVHEVALLEASIQRVFDADRDEAPFQLDHLLAIPNESWGDARFRLIQALELHRFAYPVNDYFQARRKDEHMDIPGPAPSWLAVFRRDYTVWRLPLDEMRYALLSTLAEELPLGEALELCVERIQVDPEEFLSNLKNWFQSWVAEGLVAGVET